MDNKSKNIRPLNVCLVAEEFPEETGWGGVGTYHYNLSKGLEALGCEVVVIARALEKESISVEGKITIYRIKPFYEDNHFLEEVIGYRLAVLKKLVEVIKKHNIDIIESPEWKAEMAFYKALDYGVPVALRMHSTMSVIKRINHFDKLTPAQSVQEYLEYTLLNQADYVSSSSKSLIELVKKYGTVNRDVEPIVNPANNVDFKPQSPPQSLKDQYNKFDLVVLYVGRIEKRKGVDLIFKSIPKILSQDKNIAFVFIGRDTPTTKNKGSFKDALLSTLDEKYKDNIFFVGFVPNLNLTNYYALADVCIFPSYYENFPAVCLEAMSCGKAVIGSKNGGMSEIIEDGISGLLFDPYVEDELTEKLESVLYNEVLRDTLARSARARIDNEFDRVKIARIILQKYHQVISNKKTSNDVV